MASSRATTDARDLGRLLTGTEARTIADSLAAGESITAAVQVVAHGRRADVGAFLRMSTLERAALIAVLRAVEGARSTVGSLDALWTMPGHVAKAGRLTSSVPHLVANARDAVTCSTYNVQRSSDLWQALVATARRPEVGLRLYLDTGAADSKPWPGAPTTSDVATELHPGAVLRTRSFDGALVRSHAKFVAVDHRFLLVTSANLSWSAEYGNVELGLLVDDRNLTEAVESEMRRAEDSLYERVSPTLPAHH